MSFCAKLIKDESGATAIEYGLIAALISIAAISAMTSLGSQVRDTFSRAEQTMSAGVATGTTTN